MTNIIWPGSVKKAREYQRQLAKKVRLVPLHKSIKIIAGIDVAFPQRGAVTRAAIVLLNYPSLKMIEKVVWEQPTHLPYIPGVLSFREGPAILNALNELTIEPDLLMFDGQGITHPLGLGIASHIGVLVNKPTIGIAKSVLVGDFNEPGLDKGNTEPVFIKEKCVAYMLRSRSKVKPIIIAPGHLITKEQALQLTISCLSRYRLPEPTRLADKLSKNQL
jgi:deoxyribonuclease V